MDNYEIDIKEVNEIKGGVEVFASATKNGLPIGFGPDGSVEIERFKIFNPPVLVDDPKGTIVRKWIDPDTGKAESRSLTENPELALQQAVGQTVALIGKSGKNIVRGKIGNTTSTFYAGGDAWSGRQGVNQTMSGISTGTGTNTQANSLSTSVMVQTSTTTDQFQNQRRGFYIFDTSALPDGDTISSATFSLVAGASGFTNEIGDVDFELCPTTTASDTAISSSDYNKQTQTRLATGVAMSAFDVTGSVYTDFPLNATGIAHIDPTTYTKFGTQSKWSFDRSFTGTWASVKLTGISTYWADETGTAKDPKLVVEHGAGVTDQALAVTAQATAGISLGYFETIAITAQATAGLIRRISNSFGVTAQATTSLVRTLVTPMVLAVTAQASASMTNMQLAVVSLAVTASSTVAVVMEKSFKRTLAVTAQAVDTLTNSGVFISRVLSVTATATVTSLKGLTLTKTISAIAKAVVSLGRDSGYTDKYPKNEATYQDKYPE